VPTDFVLVTVQKGNFYMKLCHEETKLKYLQQDVNYVALYD